jgi:UDP-glucose 4-epimerase
VADQLSDAERSVRICDRIPSPWLKKGQSQIIGDLLGEDLLSEAIKIVSVVFNFPALADINEALTRLLDTIRVNVLGNALALELSRKHAVDRFILASSGYVYSREGGFYRFSKQAAEQYVEEFQRVYGLAFTILWYGSLYGPRSDQSNGLYRIVRSALRDGCVSYRGSTEAVRGVHSCARCRLRERYGAVG